MKHFLVLLSMIILLITSCTLSPVTKPADLPPDTALTNPPEDNMPPLNSDEYPVSPKPDDADLTRGIVYVNQVELLIRESYPPQISIGVSGDLPTPCHQLRVKISKPDSENKISADFYSVVDSKKSCIQVLKSFQEYIDLGTFPSGHYTVWVNGELAGEFDA
jgi:hypothetical protein